MVKKLLIFILLLNIGCSSDKPKGKTQAEVLFKEAKQLMDEEHFLLATEKLNQLKHQFPYSFYATPAELALAEIHFKQESYVDAAASFLVFRDFHPKHKQIPYVIYMIAESYFNQLPDTYDRDLSAAFEAIKYYNELLAKYPNSEYAKNSANKIAKCYKMVRNKQKYIADFYFKTEVFDAARYRYLDILKTFKNKNLRDHAMVRVLQSSLKLKDYSECVDYSKKFSKLISKENAKRVSSIAKDCKAKIR